MIPFAAIVLPGIPSPQMRVEVRKPVLARESPVSSTLSVSAAPSPMTTSRPAMPLTLPLPSGDALPMLTRFDPAPLPVLTVVSVTMFVLWTLNVSPPVPSRTLSVSTKEYSMPPAPMPSPVTRESVNVPVSPAVSPLSSTLSTSLLDWPITTSLPAIACVVTGLVEPTLIVFVELPTPVSIVVTVVPFVLRTLRVSTRSPRRIGELRSRCK